MSLPHHQHPKSKKEFVFLIILLGSIIAIGPLSIDMYLPAFSTITQSFHTSESLVQLSLTSFFIGMAVSQILYGPIIDRLGKRTPLFFGIFVFVFSSIACCFANSIEQLVILRFFQAVGCCACMVIPRAIVRDIFSPQESARVYSHLMLVMGIAPILAPLFGSIILSHFGWKAIFVFLTAFGIFCLILSYLAIPETRGADENDEISRALKKYLGILKDRNFVICALSGGLAMSGLFSYITGSSFVYTEIFGLSAKEYSLVFASNSIGFVIISQVNARLLKKFPMQKILEKILFIPLICGITLIFIGDDQPTFWAITIPLFIMMASTGAIMPNTTALALANQGAHSGSASALLGTMQFIIATITSFSVSKLHDGTTFPLSLVFGICGILCFMVYKIFTKKHQDQIV